MRFAGKFAGESGFPNGRSEARFPPRRQHLAALSSGRRDCCARAGGGRARPEYKISQRSQSRAARGGGDAGRPGAGARRRRNRQNPRADNAHRPYPQPRPGAPERNPRGHLHQQGRARDEDPRRPLCRRNCRGHAVAWHLPFDRREALAPARRAGRPEARLHHSGHRRPGPSAQAAHRGGEPRRQALAGDACSRRSSTAGRTGD